MKQTDPQYKLRMPKHLKEALQALAEKEARSLNAEIVHRLTMSVGLEHPFSRPLLTADATSAKLADEAECESDEERLMLLTELLGHHIDEIAKVQQRISEIAQDLADMHKLDERPTGRE